MWCDASPRTLWNEPMWTGPTLPSRSTTHWVLSVLPGTMTGPNWSVYDCDLKRAPPLPAPRRATVAILGRWLANGSHFRYTPPPMITETRDKLADLSRRLEALRGYL